MLMPHTLLMYPWDHDNFAKVNILFICILEAENYVIAKINVAYIWNKYFSNRVALGQALFILNIIFIKS